MITLEEAIKTERCFSRSTLKTDYRMKPGPGIQPVKFYKDRFGGKYGVYRIVDCVPMRPLRPASEKQIEAGKKLVARSRMNSKRGQAALKAQAWITADALFLDSETTGLDGDDQVIEIALVDSHGQVLLDTRLRPNVPISFGAQNVHGICAADLVDAPTWAEIAPKLRGLLEGRQVVAFNHAFDSRLLQQTAKAHGADSLPWDWSYTEHCAMDLAARAFGATNRHGSISLADAVDAAGIDWQGEAHSAAGDARTTLALVKAIADFPL